jgi:hypothetical protein
MIYILISKGLLYLVEYMILSLTVGVVVGTCLYRRDQIE